jgi:hypothetical protein
LHPHELFHLIPEIFDMRYNGMYDFYIEQLILPEDQYEILKEKHDTLLEKFTDKSLSDLDGLERSKLVLKLRSEGTNNQINEFNNIVERINRTYSLIGLY